MKDKLNRYREEEKEALETEMADEENVIKVTKTSKKTKDTNESLSSKEVASEFEIEKLANDYLRLRADYDNFRKRSIEERTQYLKYAAQPFLEKLINITDLFDKAVSAEVEDEKLKNYLIGFKMINQSFQELLNEEGVKKIETIGKKFDPLVHHAVDLEYNPDKEENTILAEMQSGYLYKDKMLRPSLVIVNKKEERNNKDE